MELKSYQKNVIADLTRYLELLTEKRSTSKAYTALWNEKNVVVDGGINGMPFYQTQIPVRRRSASRFPPAAVRPTSPPAPSSPSSIPCQSPVPRPWSGWCLPMPF